MSEFYTHKIIHLYGRAPNEQKNHRTKKKQQQWATCSNSPLEKQT